MPTEYRQDPVTGRWVVIADGRADRPIEFDAPQIRKPDQVCPFCPGNEEATPSASLQVVDPQSGNWQVRVVPNLYPAFDAKFDIDINVATAGTIVSSNENAFRMPALGFHEVFIESRRHVSRMTELSDSEIEVVIAAYQQRLRQLADDPRIAYALLFKNCGVRAGISLEHIHSQLVALPIVPPVIQEELTGARDKFVALSKCVFCSSIDDLSDRVVEVSEGYAVTCPYASRFPYEMCIQPTEHEEHFHNHQHASRLARILKRSLMRLEQKVPNASYNVILHTSPFDSNRYDYYHWHIEVIPRIATVAGLEWGSGIHVNVVRPEEAARELREAL